MRTTKVRSGCRSRPEPPRNMKRILLITAAALAATACSSGSEPAAAPSSSGNECAAAATALDTYYSEKADEFAARRQAMTQVQQALDAAGAPPAVKANAASVLASLSRDDTPDVEFEGHIVAFFAEHCPDFGTFGE